MLSILIPVYNFDVRTLVKDLQKQCIALDITFEILAFDDGSASEFGALHRPMNSWTGVNYQEMPKNLGRSRIRNRLAEAARYPYLLFMDGDSKVISDHYITTYLKNLDPHTLLYGGRAYADRPPPNADQYFHWWYGSQREVQAASVRQQRPYHAFMTNNFVIPKHVFYPIQFDEQLLQYGHEDTLFGLELQRRDIPILHLDNPLEHIGLEPKAPFLDKSEKAIENLFLLARQHPDLETRLLKLFRQLCRWKLTGLVRQLLAPIKRHLLRQLNGQRPNLKVFDLYKLLLLLEVNHRHEASL